MAGAAPLPMRRHLFQDLSLPSQPRDRSRPLAEILARRGHRRGAAGSASSAGRRTRDPRRSRRRPTSSTSCAALVGPTGARRERDRPADRSRRRPAGDQRGRAARGAGARRLPDVRAASGACWSACDPGMTEREAVAAARLGRHAPVLPPDADAPARGRRSGCSARATGRSSAATGSPSRSGSGARSTAAPGSSSRTPASCRPASRDYVDRLVGPYFEAVAEWYGALHIGQTGGALHEIIDRRLGDPFFGIFLNPGHQIHLDEWVNSPISPGSTIELRSGMAFQVDIIPATGTDYFTTNIEDGIALADAHAARRVRGALPGGLGADPGAPRVHGRRARDRPPPGRAAVLEHPGLPAAVPARGRTGR